MSRGSRIFVLSLAALLLLTVGPLVGVPARAAVATEHESLTVVADGLHSPRGLAFGPGNNLYIAQAGDVTGTSAIFLVGNPKSEHPKLHTVIDGLPTFCDEEGCIGVDGISVRGRGTNLAIYAIVGLAPQNTGDPAAGELLKIDRSGNTQTIASVGSFDFAWSQAHSALWEEFIAGDSNPYDVLALPGHIYVVDAGTNTLDEVMPDGSIHVLAFFPNEVIRDAVPTCVAQGPDGALYIGTLALVDSVVLGPSAKVYRLDPSKANLADPTVTPMDVWASGLFPINGCSFGPDGDFYASQLFTNSAHDFGAIFANPMGDVVKIPWGDPGTHISLTGGALSFTGDVAVGPEGTVYVSDGTAFVPPGSGRVVAISHS